jgi:hypothetical protein
LLLNNGYGFNSGIQELRDLGIEGILFLLFYRFYALIPQSLNPLIPQFLNLAPIGLDIVA